MRKFFFIFLLCIIGINIDALEIKKGDVLDFTTVQIFRVSEIYGTTLFTVPSEEDRATITGIAQYLDWIKSIRLIDDELAEVTFEKTENKARCFYEISEKENDLYYNEIKNLTILEISLKDAMRKKKIIMYEIRDSIVFNQTILDSYLRQGFVKINKSDVD